MRGHDKKRVRIVSPRRPAYCVSLAIITTTRKSPVARPLAFEVPMLAEILVHRPGLRGLLAPLPCVPISVPEAEGR